MGESSGNRLSQWCGLIAGALSVVVTQRIAARYHLGESVALYLIGAAFLAVVALLTRLLGRPRNSDGTIFIFAGMACGVFVDAQFDLFVNHVDQNLWPIAIVMWCLFGLLPVAFGYVVGGWLRHRLDD